MKRKASELDEDGEPQRISKRQVNRTWSRKAREATADVRARTWEIFLPGKNVVFRRRKNSMLRMLAA